MRFETLTCGPPPMPRDADPVDRRLHDQMRIIDHERAADHHLRAPPVRFVFPRMDRSVLGEAPLNAIVRAQIVWVMRRSVPLEVPGLGERRDDIPELVEHFCIESCKRHRLPYLAVSRRALAACRDSPWPGHNRQLAHAIEAAVIRASG